MESSKILQILKQHGLSAALLALLIFFASVMIEKTSNIETNIVGIQMKLVEIQSKMVDKDWVTDLVEKEIAKHQKMYHNKKE